MLVAARLRSKNVSGGGGGGGGTYSSAVLADSPLVYWRLGDTSGTTAVDASGNSRNGTYHGTYTLNTTGLITGDTDKAVTFSAGYADIGYATWQNVNPFTLEAVIKPSNVITGPFNIWDRDNNSDRIFQFRINSSRQIEFIWWTSGGIRSVAGSTVLVSGTKYHVAATYDNTNGKVWLNGAQDGTVAATGTTTAGTSLGVMIGANSSGGTYGGGQQFQGVIDEAAFYGAALSSTRIAAHYALV